MLAFSWPRYDDAVECTADSDNATVLVYHQAQYVSATNIIYPQGKKKTHMFTANKFITLFPAHTPSENIFQMIQPTSFFENDN